MQSDARPHTVNEGMDLYLRDEGDVFDFPRTSMRPYSSLSEVTRRNYESVVQRIRKDFGSRCVT